MMEFEDLPGGVPLEGDDHSLAIRLPGDGEVRGTVGGRFCDGLPDDMLGEAVAAAPPEALVLDDVDELRFL